MNSSVISISREFGLLFPALPAPASPVPCCSPRLLPAIRPFSNTQYSGVRSPSSCTGRAGLPQVRPFAVAAARGDLKCQATGQPQRRYTASIFCAPPYFFRRPEAEAFFSAFQKIKRRGSPYPHPSLALEEPIPRRPAPRLPGLLPRPRRLPGLCRTLPLLSAVQADTSNVPAQACFDLLRVPAYCPAAL